MGNKHSSATEKILEQENTDDTGESIGGKVFEKMEVPLENFAEFMLRRLKTFGDNIAMVNGTTDETLTYSALVTRAEKLAGGLRHVCVGPGNVICILTANRLDYPVMYLAVTLLGAIFQPLNPTYTVDELSKMFSQCGTKMVFTDLPLVDKVKDADPDMIVYTFDTTSHGSYKSLVDVGKVVTKGPRMVPNSAPAVLLSTSGTTGFPKAAVLSHLNALSASIHATEVYVAADGKEMVVKEGDVCLQFIPMCHVFGLHVVLSAGLILGLKNIIMSQFQPKQLLSLIQTHKVKVTQIVPPVALLLATHPMVEDYDLSSLELILCGGAPLQPGLETKLATRLAPTHIIQGYGMTEMSVSHVNTLAAHRLGSCGKPLTGVNVKVADLKTREALATNQEGELCIKCDHVMMGYLNQWEATQNAFDEEGWLLTGDIAMIDDDGYMFITGRLKELIKYKGFQVPPALLEDILLQHPAVADAAVIGIEDEAAGELPRAFLVKKAGVEADDEEINSFINDKVAPHMKLRGGIQFVDDIPKNATGKILRNKLKELASLQDLNCNIRT